MASLRSFHDAERKTIRPRQRPSIVSIPFLRTNPTICQTSPHANVSRRCVCVCARLLLRVPPLPFGCLPAWRALFCRVPSAVCDPACCCHALALSLCVFFARVPSCFFKLRFVISPSSSSHTAGGGGWRWVASLSSFHDAERKNKQSAQDNVPQYCRVLLYAHIPQSGRPVLMPTSRVGVFVCAPSCFCVCLRYLLVAFMLGAAPTSYTFPPLPRRCCGAAWHANAYHFNCNGRSK